MNLDGAVIDSSVIGGNTAAAGTFTTLTASGDLTVDTSTLKVDSTNNLVGVGTASPNSYNSNTNNFVIRDSGNGGITISTGASNTGYVAFNDGEDTTIEGLIAYNQSNDVMSFRTASTDDRLVINGSGNVGINTASPDSKMHLHSTGAVDMKFSSDTTGQTGSDGVVFGINSNGSTYLWNYENQYIYFGTNNTERMRIDSSGRFAIGTTSPSYTLDVNSSGNASAFRVSNSTNGQDINCTISNSGTTAGDDSLFDITTQNGAGDPKVRFTIAGYENYEIGIDNTDGDKLKISQGSALGTDDRITVAGGSVGIGNDNPGGMHSAVNRLVVGSGSGNQGMAIWSGAGSSGMIGFARANAANTDAYDGSIEYEQGARSLRFAVNAGAERGRFTSNGFLVGTTNDSVNSNTLGHTLDKDGYAAHRRNSAPSLYLNRYGTEGNIQIFYHAGTGVGSISVSSDATAFNTSSDYRLKNVKGSIQNALERTLALNPVEFEWKESGKTSEGFIAHEAQEIFADAVSGEKDGEEMQGMDYGRITPLLVKAIQELSAEVEELKQQINELRGN